MPRKSDVHIPGAGPPATDNKETSGVSIEDNTLPKTIIARLAKGVLPPNTVIQKDAQLALTKGTTVFINFLCSVANEIAVKNGRKTFMPKDVLEALDQVEMGEFRPRLEAELAKYEEIQTEKRAAQRKAAQTKAETPTTAGTGAVGDNSGKHLGEEGDAPPSKKRKANGKSIPASVDKSGSGGGGGGNGEGDDIDDDDVDDDADDAMDDYDDAGVDEIEDDEGDSRKKIDVGDVVPDVDEKEPSDDEALDNGEESEVER